MIIMGDYARHYKVALRNYRNEEDAIDAFHDVVVACLPQRERLGKDWPRYLMTALLNHMRTPARLEVIKHYNNEKAYAMYPYTNQGYDTVEITNLLPKITKTLTPSQRKIFLSHLENPSRGDDVANECGVTIDNANQLLRSARIKVKPYFIRHT